MVLDGVTAEEQETLVSVAQKMMHNIEKALLKHEKRSPATENLVLKRLHICSCSVNILMKRRQKRL